MKYLKFFLLFAVISITPFCEGKNDFRVYSVLSPNRSFWSWVDADNLFRLYDDYSNTGIYFYLDENEQLRVLSNDIHEISIYISSFLDNEIPIKQFIESKLSKVLLVFNSNPPTYILDTTYLNYRFSGLDDGFWTYIYGEGYMNNKDLHNKLLKKYSKNRDIKFSENFFTIVFNVLNQKGNIEEWNIKGTVDPFNIEFLNKKTLEEASIYHIPTN